LTENREIYLINSEIDAVTGKAYTCIGDKYRDAMSRIPKCDLIEMIDSDDWMLPNHYTVMEKGYQEAKGHGKRAYKPYYFYFRYTGAVSIEHNTMEGSIIMESSYLKSK